MILTDRPAGGHKSLIGEVAVVTGGASGIGRGISETFAAEGASVVIADLDSDLAGSVAAEITQAGARAIGASCDVRDRRSIEAMVRQAVAEFGLPTILINNAGYCRVLPLMEVTEDIATDLWRVHVLGSLMCSQVVLESMIDAGYGRIVMIVSESGVGASAHTTLYQSAKAAQTSLARGIGLAVAEHGVTVNCISPGLVETPLWDSLEADYQHTKGISSRSELEARRAASPYLRRVAPADIARAAVFLCLRESASINGQVIAVD